VTSALRPHRRVFAGVDGNRLVADVWGAGPPVLLLHGGGQTRHSWSEVARRLATLGRTAIATDLRGHGDSDWSPDQTYPLHGYVRDLRAICATLGERPALVGASMGGIAAMLAVGESANGGVTLANCLVLVDVTPRMEESGVSRVREFMLAAPDGFTSLDEAAEAIAAYLPGRPRPTHSDGLAKNLRRGDDGRYRWHWDPKILDDLATDSARRHELLRHGARGVRVPTLLIHGGRSDVVSNQGVQELEELIPHAEVSEVSDAGHMVAGDDNEVFVIAIVEFVARY